MDLLRVEEHALTRNLVQSRETMEFIFNWMAKKGEMKQENDQVQLELLHQKIRRLQNQMEHMQIAFDRLIIKLDHLILGLAFYWLIMRKGSMKRLRDPRQSYQEWQVNMNSGVNETPVNTLCLQHLDEVECEHALLAGAVVEE